MIRAQGHQDSLLSNFPVQERQQFAQYPVQAEESIQDLTAIRAVRVPHMIQGSETQGQKIRMIIMKRDRFQGEAAPRVWRTIGRESSDH